MKHWLSFIVVSLMLTACGSGGTTDVSKAPGFRNGKATHPLVKLGNPYDIDGETYYPKYDPDYVETGMASWYGPGFHGKSTANGERFNTGDMTAAHRTLPLPSIVKVTNLKNNKSVVVRVNDRGPFARDRILDVSQRAAQQLDMIRSGTAKVRVEYLSDASKRYISLLEGGRSIANINVERDVLLADNSFAEASKSFQTASNEPSWFSRINPISSAQAAEPKPHGDVIAVETKTTTQLPALEDTPPSILPPKQGAVVGTTNVNTAPVPAAARRSPFDLLNETPERIEDPKKPVEVVKETIYYKPVIVGGYAVQLGVFGNVANAEALKNRFEDVADVDVANIDSNGRKLFRVRLGPFKDQAAAREVLDRARSMGVPDAKVVKL